MIKYVKGDATNPCIKDGIRIIAHICNDVGKFGAGFAKCIAERWGIVRDRYVEWSIHPSGTLLGDCQVVPVGSNIYVVNMIAQHGVRSSDNLSPIDYNALAECLNLLYDWVASYTKVKNCLLRPKYCPDITIHMPRIGCGLAGGDWRIISSVLNICIPYPDVYIYDLEHDDGKP